MASNEVSVENARKTTTDNNAEKTLIILSAPSVKNKYYSSKFKAIIDYMVNFVNIIHGKDDVLILVKKNTLPYLVGRVPPETLCTASIDDIWIRDFSSVIPTKQVKFKYLPDYLNSSNAKYIDNGFKNWCTQHEVKFHKRSNIILDGGNVVDNAAGTRVVVTERILQDNPSLTKSSAKELLKTLLGVKEVAIIPEVPGDTTGHSDGLVTWPMDDKIIVAKVEGSTHEETIEELKDSFPGVQIVEVPNYCPTAKWKDFTTAKNCFVNSIVTDNYMYMPTFDDGHDEEMLKVFQSHTNKTVVPVSAQNVAMMGGSVRCLSWQVKHMNRSKLIKMIKEKEQEAARKRKT